jgi:hypothetical protein
MLKVIFKSMDLKFIILILSWLVILSNNTYYILRQKETTEIRCVLKTFGRIIGIKRREQMIGSFWQ